MPFKAQHPHQYYLLAHVSIKSILKKDLSAVSCASTVCVADDCCYAPFVPADTAALKAAIASCLAETIDGACPIFAGKDRLIGDWDVSQITDMTNLFYNTKFNQDISKWKTGAVATMDGMFNVATIFNQGK